MYLVTKLSKGRWALTYAVPGWLTPLGIYKERKAAVLTARLLAGRNGKVSIQ
jgi:hypothetical protein